MPKQTIKEVAELIRKNNSFILISHVDPDGDTLGSLLALKMILRKLGKRTKGYSHDPIPTIYDFMPEVNSIVIGKPPYEKFDLAIALDAGDIRRLGKGVDLIRNHVQGLINIDHHPDNTHYGDVNFVIPVSSVAELIYLLAQELKVEIDKKMAICLYTALMTDTGSFRYENTTALTLIIAGELVKAGAVPSTISRKVYETKTMPSMRILSTALKNAQLLLKGKIICSVISYDEIKKAKAVDQDMTGLVDALRSINGVEVAVLIREVEKNYIKINFRAKTKVNVSEIAKQLGGGGHIRASGASLAEPLKTAQKKVINTVLSHVKKTKF